MVTFLHIFIAQFILAYDFFMDNEADRIHNFKKMTHKNGNKVCNHEKGACNG